MILIINCLDELKQYDFYFKPTELNHPIPMHLHSNLAVQNLKSEPEPRKIATHLDQSPPSKPRGINNSSSQGTIGLLNFKPKLPDSKSKYINTRFILAEYSKRNINNSSSH